MTEGELPKDLTGYVFALVQAGSVNNELPIPKYLPDGSINPEFGTPLMNGDGMLYRFDFSTPGKVELTTRLMKPPCFYADLALARGTTWNGIAGFSSFGISRMNLLMGFRNELNTAFVPTWFKNAGAPYGLLTYDVGRHYALDTQS
ncbi:MAG: lignostilbene-alpha,beta-dioxygenase, partial [Bacteroidota bacterium]